METIFLKVTSKVISFAKNDINGSSKQIAIKTSSANLKEKIIFANKNKRLKLKIANNINLNLGDNGAIWRSHNKDREKEFDALFHFLSEFPDQEFEFVCAIN